MAHPMAPTLYMLRERMIQIASRKLDDQPAANVDHQVVIWSTLELDTSLQAILVQLEAIAEKLDRVGDNCGGRS